VRSHCGNISRADWGDINRRIQVLLRVRVSLLDRPGALLAVARVLADIGSNIVDIEILATGDGQVVDDLVIDFPGMDQAALTESLSRAGAEVLNIRRTVRLSGQRPDLDLLQRVASEPTAALATLVSLAPPIYSADWAVVVPISDDTTVVRSSPGAPNPLPPGLPVPIGPLPRRALIDGTAAGKLEIVGVSCGEHFLYLGRAEGPTFLQVELLQLRRVVELAMTLATAASH
jgi:predicted amino acid-binding ACT domain protein